MYSATLNYCTLLGLLYQMHFPSVCARQLRVALTCSFSSLQSLLVLIANNSHIKPSFIFTGVPPRTFFRTPGSPRGTRFGRRPCRMCWLTLNPNEMWAIMQHLELLMNANYVLKPNRGRWREIMQPRKIKQHFLKEWEEGLHSCDYISENAFLILNLSAFSWQ